MVPRSLYHLLSLHDHQHLRHHRATDGLQLAAKKISVEIVTANSARSLKGHCLERGRPSKNDTNSWQREL